MEAASFSINTEDEHEVPLSVQFRGKEIPVSWSAAVTRDEAVQGVASEPFLTWLQRCTNATGTTTTTTTTKQLCVHHIEIQSVDMFGPRLVFLFCYDLFLLASYRIFLTFHVHLYDFVSEKSDS